jgi:hypothetical protein
MNSGNRFRDHKKDFRDYREDNPYKRMKPSHSTSPRPGPFNDNSRFKKNFEPESRQGKPFDRQQAPYKRRNDPPSRYEEERPSKSESRDVSAPKTLYKKNSHKKIRCDFPEQLLYEYGFLASPQRIQKSDTVFKLVDPNSGKNEVDEVLASIASNK